MVNAGLMNEIQMMKLPPMLILMLIAKLVNKVSRNFSEEVSIPSKFLTAN